MDRHLVQRMIGPVLAAAMLAAACSSGDVGVAPPPTPGVESPSATVPPATVPPTPTATEVPEPPESVCESVETLDDWYEIDLDGAAPAEVVYLRPLEPAGDPGPRTHELGACAGNELLSSTEVEGTALALLGFADLDDDATAEVLVVGESDRGRVVQAMTLGLRGFEVTDLGAESWIDGGGSPLPDALFDGAGFECDDIDGDGEPEFLITNYWPADDLQHVDVAVAVRNGRTVTPAGVDSYETDLAQALDRWSRPDRCAPGTPPRVGVDYRANGWGRLDPGDAFTSEGSVALTAVARGGADDTYVAVGAELPSLLLGEFFAPRPVIWSSPDAITWVRSDLGAAEGELRDVVALPDGRGFVAVGRTGSLTAAAWRSPDGRTWDLVEVPLAGPGQGGFHLGPVMSQVISTPLGLVAVGTEDYAPDDGAPGEDIDASVWLSADDGRSWERIEDPSLGSIGYQPNAGAEFNGELVGVAYQPGVGLVAVGSASDPSDRTLDFPRQLPAAWVSTDARSWERHDIDAELRLRGVTSAAGMFAAHGVSTLMGSPSQDGAMLLSTDGKRWSEVSGPFDGLGAVEGAQAINAVVDIADVGLMALGSDEQEIESVGAAAVWWSTDRAAGWQRETHDDVIFEAFDTSPTATMTGGVWSDDTLVVVGFVGRSIELEGGGTACCIVGAAVWLWPAPGGGG